MATVTFFRDFDYQLTPTRLKAYLADNTYPDVLDEIANAVVEAGYGEIVPDEIAGDIVADHELDPPVLKATRRKRRSAWDR